MKGDDRFGILSWRNDLEIAKFGFSGGLTACFNLNSLVGIESGILYTNKGYRTEKIDLITPDPYDPVLLKYGQWIRHVYDYRYIDVPLKARFSVGRQKIRFSANIGITTGFLAVATNAIQDKDGKDKSPNIANTYNRINLSPTISAGIDYKVISKSNLRIEPTFRYGLLNIHESNDDVHTEESLGIISEYLWDVGVSVSYLIKIK